MSEMGGAVAREVGLSDVLDLAFRRWRPAAAHRPNFGAAGPRDAPLDDAIGAQYFDFDLTDPFRRLVNTTLGQRAANAVANQRTLSPPLRAGVETRRFDDLQRQSVETRTMTAMRRLSVETMAVSLRNTGQAKKDDRLLVIPEQRDRPPVLMLMSTEVEAVEDSRVVSNEMDLPLAVLSKALPEAADPNDSSPEAAALRQVLRGGDTAVAELFLIAQPEIVRTRQPKMMPLCAPHPHIRVDCGPQVSTVGVFCRDADNELGVTACYHGTGPVGTVVTINQQHYKVKRVDVVQDTVFIPLGNNFNVPTSLRGRAGILGTREPARADQAHFDGATNQNCTTRIFGADAGLLRARPTIMLKIQTDPDTDKGDSGCALIDDADHVLGFAFERTDYKDYPQFTDWIWAANALRALQLTPY